MSPPSWQERIEHDLMRDFANEVPGYMNDTRIAAEFDALPLTAGPEAMEDSLRLCYGMLIELELIDGKEMVLLDAWLQAAGGVMVRR